MREENRDALIGETGFVGGSLIRQHAFSALFNRSNIGEAHGQVFGTLVCAAAPGSMFEANRFPDEDSAAIDALIGTLRQVQAERMVLISSIAVLADFNGGDTESTTAFQTKLAYGRNRRRLETFCAEHFSACTVLRLPALFGAGLRKNFLFDILNPVPSMLTEVRLTQARERLPDGLGDALAGLYDPDRKLGMLVVDRDRLEALPVRAALEAALRAQHLSALEFTNPQSTFQYYDMSALWDDIRRAVKADLAVLHLAPEPVSAHLVYERLTGEAMPQTNAPVHAEDMRTDYAYLWGQSGPYSASAEDTLAAISRFGASARR